MPEIPSTALAVRPLHEGRVLVSVEAKHEWAAMPILSVEQIDYHESWTLNVGVNVDALPFELRESLSGPVDLYGPAGKLCTVTLEQPTIEARVLPEDNNDSFDGKRLWQVIESQAKTTRSCSCSSTIRATRDWLSWPSAKTWACLAFLFRP